MKKQANLTCIMIVQQLDIEYWIGWDEKYIDEANKGNIHPLLEEVVRRFNEDGCIVSEAHGIIHDKDEQIIWDQKEMKNIIEKKAKHVHLLIKFEKGNTLNNLAVSVSIPPQQIEKSKSGRYGWDNMLSYIIHAKDQKKYQYNPQEVITVLGENYFSIYNRRMETWVKGRATKEAVETNLSIDYVVSEILKGNLTKSQVLLTDDLYKVYALHKRKINDAFETVGESKSYQTMEDLENGKFKKTVIFIQAESGAGKTVLSKNIIGIIQKVAQKFSNKRWDYCLTASKNSFDEYCGQDILLLDDIRGDSLTVSDWLKLLDPHTISPISARYHNKMGSAKVIIITSTKEPDEFFERAKGNFQEDLGQFFRRIDLLIKIDNDYSLFNSTKNLDYIPTVHPNPLEPDVHSYKFSKVQKYQKASKAIDKAINRMEKQDKAFSSSFSNISDRRKNNKEIDKIIKVFIKNMKWSKQKRARHKPAKASVTSHPKK